jgi:hypothetical protein
VFESGADADLQILFQLASSQLQVRTQNQRQSPTPFSCHASWLKATRAATFNVSGRRVERVLDVRGVMLLDLEPSLFEPQSLLPGNGIFGAETKRSKWLRKVGGHRGRDNVSLNNPANSGRVAQNRGISIGMRVRGGPGRTRTANQIVMKWSRRGPSAACLGAYATAPGRFFGHNADTKIATSDIGLACITSA